MLSTSTSTCGPPTSTQPAPNVLRPAPLSQKKNTEKVRKSHAPSRQWRVSPLFQHRKPSHEKTIGMELRRHVGPGSLPKGPPYVLKMPAPPSKLGGRRPPGLETNSDPDPHLNFRQPALNPLIGDRSLTRACGFLIQPLANIRWTRSDLVAYMFSGHGKSQLGVWLSR